MTQLPVVILAGGSFPTSIANGADITGTTGADAFIWDPSAGNTATVRFNTSPDAGAGDGVGDFIIVGNTNAAGTLTVGDFDMSVDIIYLAEAPAFISASVTASGNAQYTVTYDNGNEQVYDIFHSSGFSANTGIFSTGTPPNTASGDDLMSGGDDADTFIVQDGFGTDTIIGGEGGNDSDTIDLTVLTGAVTVTHSGDGTGTITDGNTITFSKIETILLPDQADVVDASGDTTGMMIGGGGGADTVLGGTGDDVLDGGTGADSISGGAGNDTLIGEDGNDVLFGGAGADSVLGGGGNDSIDGNEGNDTIFGGTGKDVISGDEGSDSIFGDAGNDFVFGGDGDDEVSGGTGNDTLQGWVGNDSIDGGTGDDSLIGGDGDDTLRDNFGDDVYDGGAGNDVIWVGANNDTVTGGADADTVNVYDDGGNNVVSGGKGGVDQDRLIFSEFSGTLGVSVTFTGNEAGTYAFNGFFTQQSGFSDFEEIEGTDYNDTLNASASSVSQTLAGGAGRDSILGGAGDDMIDGGDGRDTISDGAGNDTVSGGAGNDRFNSGAGDDIITGGSGFDYYDVSDGFGNDTVDLGAEEITINSAYADEYIGFYSVTSAVTVTYTGSGGTATDGTGTITFDNVDGWEPAWMAGGTFDARLATFDVVYFDYGGATTAYGSAFDDLIAAYGADASDRYYDGGAGNDYLDTGGGNDTILGGDGNDTIFARGGDDTIDAGLGDDEISGGAGNDTILGGLGADTLGGGDGDDYIDGGDGDDFLTTGLGQDTLVGGSGNDTLMNSDGDDSLDGGAGDDSIVATGGEDTLRGGTGDDYMDGGDDADTFIIEDNFGNDTIIGGEGVTDGTDTDADTVDASALSGNVTVNFTGDEAGTITDGTDTITFSEVENVFTGSGADVLDASSDSAGVGLFSGAGADTITGGTGADYIEAGTGDDTVFGDAGDDTIIGGAGADTLHGGQGADRIEGGDGNDSLRGEEGDDSIFGGAGTDFLLGDGGDDYLDGGDDNDFFFMLDGFGNDTIVGGEGGDDRDAIFLTTLSGPVTVTYTGDEAGTITDGTDTITFSEIEQIVTTQNNDSIDASADSAGAIIDGRGGDDQIIGGSGADSLKGGTGNDTVFGGSGNDTLSGGEGNDSLDGDAGDDLLQGGAGDDTIIGDAGNDTAFGGDGADQIYDASGANVFDGGAGNDSLFGGVDSDTLIGGTGDDRLVGNAGDDSLEGGAGNDTFEGGIGNDTFAYTPGSGADTITDFNAGNTGTLSDGDNTNNDFIELSGFYDNIYELHADQADDGILNQSNTTGPDAVDYSDNDQFGFGEGITFQGASADNSSFTSENTGVVCFTTGTAIRTPRGDVLIDDLKVGDWVATMDNGPQRIAWIGKRHVTHSELLQNDRLHPVLIKKGVLGAERDLLVSRPHGMLLGQDHFGRAVHLSKTMPGIRVAKGKRHVTYVHLMFEAHQIIFAEGIPSESYYPGPMALNVLSHASREKMQLIFPTLTAATQLDHIMGAYGNTARVFLENKKAVSAWLSEGTDVVKKEIGKWDVDLAMEQFEAERLLETVALDQIRKSMPHAA